MTDRIPINLETAEERIWRDGEPIQMHGTVFRLLRLFIEREGELVTKRDILRSVWPDTNVSDASVKDCVRTLRGTLGDSAANPIYIETVRGRGYRFLGGIDVTERLAPDAPASEPDSSTLQNDRPTSAPPQPSRPTVRPIRLLLVGFFVIAIAIGVFYGWQVSRNPVPARTDRISLPIPEKPSIAVVPFVNVNPVPDVDWLSIGLSSNLIAALAASPDMVVISQNALGDMTGAKPGEIAERYGVRYVLDGTIQSDDSVFRITARLVDALAGRTLWSEKWNRAHDDIFNIQDEITDAIVEELQVRLTIGEQARSWRANIGSIKNMRDLEAGRVAFQYFTPDGHAQVSRLWGGIYEREPDLPLAWSLMGWLHWHKVLVQLSTDPVADLLAAQDWAQKAIDAGLSGNPHVLYATSANFLGQSEQALEYAEQGVLAAPGEADVVQIAGFVFAENGRLDDGIKLMRRGMRLEPDYPDWLAGTMVVALVKADRRPEARHLAVEMIEKDVPDDNAKFSALISLVVLSVRDGRLADARHTVATLLDHRPDFDMVKARESLRYRTFVNFSGHPEYRTHYLAALETAGVPAGE